MGWTFAHPLYSLATEDQNKEAKYLWEHENLGGIKENNNPLPRPIIGLLVLTILTAFSITFPLYGQRPTAAIFADYVTLMNSAEVQKVLHDKSLTPEQADEKAMALITKTLERFDSPYTFQRQQHHITMNQLRAIAPKIIELQRSGADLEEYTIVGPTLGKANFFNIQPDGTVIAKQPWWDKGYAIDVFWILAFCLSVAIAVKRLPHFTWQPDHSKAH
ncbi:MAG: hypothetical protein D6682_06960 [Zetaproteobacteria bacterium]|nr:MAG: hypothetical protein D6682_06960 [Zetaproteobacteria bacterium]